MDVKQVIESKSYKERLTSSTDLPLNISVHTHTNERWMTRKTTYY